MALVVLTVLLDRGIISGNTFSALTLVAVITTLLAMPLARLGLRLGDRQRASLRRPRNPYRRRSTIQASYPAVPAPSGESRCPKTNASIRAGRR